MRASELEGIVAGRVTLAFRRWTRPTVRAGGTLRTAAGVLAIDAVDVVDPAAITEDEARLAGFAGLGALLAFLDERPDGSVHRVSLRLTGPDPRAALREAEPGPAEVEDILRTLRAMDARSRSGPWTARTLRTIAARPGVRAADLAAEAGLETLPFKRSVRRLKEMGLTESLEVGYRVSPRGRAVLDAGARLADAG